MTVGHMVAEQSEHVEVQVERKDKAPEQRMLGVLAAFAVTWGLVCLVGFTLTEIASPADLAKTYTPGQVSYLQNTPAWVGFGKAMMTVGLLCGAVYLLLRKKSAYHWFSVSLVGTLIIMMDSVLRGGFNILGGMNSGVNLGMVIVGVFLFWASYSAFYEGQLDD